MVYLAVQAIVVAVAFFLAFEPDHGFRPLRAMEGLMGLVACFIISNLCYSTVYAIEFIVMGTPWETWFHRYRTGVLLLGTMFAAAVAFISAMSLFWMMRDVF